MSSDTFPSFGTNASEMSKVPSSRPIRLEAPSALEAPVKSNPFLAAPPRGEAPAPPPSVSENALTPESPEAKVTPRVPLVPERKTEVMSSPTHESPALRDPHREFRKGTWTKPLLLVALGAGLLGALSLLNTEKPAPEAPAPVPLSAQAEPEAFTIGSSQAPDRIPDVPAHRTTKRRSDADSESAERPSGIVPEKQFASEFKSKASKDR